MFFRRKIDKFIDIAEIEKDLDKKQSYTLEKGDFKAMLLAAGIVIGPFVIGLIALMYLIGWLFGAFSS